MQYAVARLLTRVCLYFRKKSGQPKKVKISLFQNRRVVQSVNRNSVITKIKFFGVVAADSREWLENIPKIKGNDEAQTNKLDFRW